MARKILLVGSVPLRPAAAVFETVAGEIGPFISRLPDGDQSGWILAPVTSFAENPALENVGRVEISAGGAQVPLFALRPGKTAADLTLGPYGYAGVAAQSYQEFKRLRDAGAIPGGVRFQVTLPGPGTSAYVVQLAPDTLLPLAREALAREIRDVVSAVPAHELTIQLDIAMEAEHEEYRRQPDAFDTPVHDVFDWTLEQMADSAAWLADQVPEEAELGFHICSIWHHYQPGGQDNAVLVDAINAIASRITRSIEYVHLPTIPEHDEADFEPLRELRLAPETELYLGVIHLSDGIDGARRRIAAATRVVPDFGVASFCGLGNPAVAEASTGPVTVGDSLHRDLRDLNADVLARTLALHREVALLG